MTIKLNLECEIDRDNFLASDPTYLGMVGGVCFYECPKYGDEAPMIAVTETQCWETDYYDLPSRDELMEDYNLVSA